MKTMPRRLRPQRGLTLVELMISMAIGLLLVAAMSVLFVNSNHHRREIELSADAIESGRYATDLLGRELSQAGFYGSLIAPAGMSVNVCSTDVAVWRDSLAVYAVGVNHDQANPACLPNRKPGTDAIFTQRTSTCRVGEAGCEAESATQAYLQVSECGTEYTVTPSVLDKGNEAAAFVLQTKACDGTVAANKRKLIRRIYYVSTADALSYVDVSLAGVSAPVLLVENIAQLQFEFAIDTDGNGTADAFGSTPADWSQVIGVRTWVLAQSSAPSRNTKDAMVFRMGDLPAADATFAAATTNLKRRVYSTYIPFVTPKLRRES